jgi:hypothetical protein
MFCIAMRRAVCAICVLAVSGAAIPTATASGARPGGSSQGLGAWSRPTRIDEKHVNLASVSCPSSGFCAAVDTLGNILTYDGVRWSPPTHVGIPGAPDGVSCASRSACGVVGAPVSRSSSEGAVTVGPAPMRNGGMWSGAIQTEANPLYAVSCPSSSFCAAVGESYAMTYHRGAWSAPAAIDYSEGPAASGALVSVSCRSSSFCMALDPNGGVFTYDGTKWSNSAALASWVTWRSVSCGSRTFCMVIGTTRPNFNGRPQPPIASWATTYNGSTWTAPTSIDEHGELAAVSCASRAFCVAVGRQETNHSPGDAVTYNGRVWRTPVRVDARASLTSVSCPSASFCVALDKSGNALTYTRSRRIRH